MTPTDEYQNLLFETSPYGNIDAIVEHDGRAVYFYLNAHHPETTRFATKACWVRNLIPGPLVINQQELEQGIPPLLPRTHARHPTAQPAPEPDSLAIVWFEEGNAAALCENGKVLAVIPPWSGMEGFHGYAEDCVAECTICWPLPAGATDPLFRRIDASREFWNSFQSDDKDYFKQLQTELMEVYTNRFGELDSYFAIDGGLFPPRGMARFRDDQKTTLLTVAMSLCPQPNVELLVDQPGWYRRIELGVQVSNELSADQLDTLQKSLSKIAGFPWRNLTWIGLGHSINWMPDKTLDDRPADFALALSDSFIREEGSKNAAPPESDTPFQMPRFRNDPVNLIWLLPISNDEQQQLLTQSITPEQLIDSGRWPR